MSEEKGGWETLVLPGRGKNNHVLSQLIHRLYCAPRYHHFALQGFAIIVVFLQGGYKSQRRKHGKQLAERKILERNDGVGGGENTRGSGLLTLLRKKKKKKKELSYRKRDRKHVGNNLLTYHPLRQTSATTTWLTQDSSLSVGQAHNLSRASHVLICGNIRRAPDCRNSWRPGSNSLPLLIHPAPLLSYAAQWWQTHPQLYTDKAVSRNVICIMNDLAAKRLEHLWLTMFNETESKLILAVKCHLCFVFWTS